MQYVVQPLLSASPDEALIAEHAPRWHAAAKVLEAQLQENEEKGFGPWLVNRNSSVEKGEEGPTIADFAVAAPMHLHRAQRLPLEGYPCIRQWLAKVEGLQAWKNTQGAVERALLPHGLAGTESVVSECEVTMDGAATGEADGPDGVGHGEVRTKVNYR